MKRHHIEVRVRRPADGPNDWRHWSSHYTRWAAEHRAREMADQADVFGHLRHAPAFDDVRVVTVGTPMQKALYFLVLGLAVASVIAWLWPSAPLWASVTMAFFLGTIGGWIGTATFLHDR